MELIENLQKLNINPAIPRAANAALDLGLKAILPDFIENDIIEIKDAFIQNGFVAGLEESKEKAEEVYKSIKGIFSGDFDSVGEIKRLIQKNGILDTASMLVDKITKILVDKKIITKSTYNLIKAGKKEILEVLGGELNNYYKIDEYDLEKLQTQIQDWKESYKNNDYESMEKNAKKITQTLEKSNALEKILNQARTIEKAQKYIIQKVTIENLTKNEKKIIESIGWKHLYQKMYCKRI